MSSVWASAMCVAVAFLTVLTVVAYAYYLCNRSPQFPPLRATPIAIDLPLPPRPALDEASLLRFPKLLYSRANVNETSCSICLSDYKHADPLRSLPDCHHVFHQLCVDPWLLLHSSCPLCRNSPAPPLV